MSPSFFGWLWVAGRHEKGDCQREPNEVHRERTNEEEGTRTRFQTLPALSLSLWRTGNAMGEVKGIENKRMESKQRK